MTYTKLSEEFPSGKGKVLVWRLLNDNQSNFNPSILPINKLKLCDKEETWWCYLPTPPDKTF